MTRTARQGLGDAGERIARQYLEKRGLTFIGANWRCPSGELDLIMRDGHLLVFVEVKTRRGERLGAAEESVTPAQAARLLLAAQAFLATRPDLAEAYWRIDLMAITLGPSGTISRVSHFEDAVQSG